MLRKAPNAPHTYDYDRVSRQSPWQPFPGRYTRFGDVLPLLEENDDALVILAPGDELTLTFDASKLPPLPPDWQRTVILESHGWDKDADLNTYRPESNEPHPFRAMSGYPWTEEERYPPSLRKIQDEWQTRRIEPPQPKQPVLTGDP